MTVWIDNILTYTNIRSSVAGSIVEATVVSLATTKCVLAKKPTEKDGASAQSVSSSVTRAAPIRTQETAITNAIVVAGVSLVITATTMQLDIHRLGFVSPIPQNEFTRIFLRS